MIRTVSQFVLLAMAGLFAPWMAGAEPPVVFGTSSPAGVDVLSPGLVVELGGAWLSKEAVVEVAGRRATVMDYWNFWGEEYLIVQAPFDLEPGRATLVVTTSAGASKPHPVAIDLYTPGLIHDFKWQCSPSTVSPGEVLTARAVGLGATSPGSNSPLVMPQILIGGEPTEVLSFALSSQVGVYELRFRAPATDGVYEVVLAIAGRKSNPQSLTVGKTIQHWASPSPIGAISAADSVITASPCGGTFAAVRLEGDPRQPPSSLAGVTVRIRDSAGVERLAPLLYVAPGQINYVVPSGTALGKATASITSSGGTVFAGAMDIRPVAPRLFTVGLLPAGLVVRVRDGIQTVEPLFQTTAMGLVPLPIDLGPETDQVFLLLFGTGLRYASTVSVSFGDVGAEVQYAGAHSEFPGLDQVNVRAPRSVVRNTELPLELVVDGQRANVTRLQFK